MHHFIIIDLDAGFLGNRRPALAHLTDKPSYLDLSAKICHQLQNCPRCW